MKKIVLTGAAGRLGSYLREPLTKLADELISTDITDVGKLYAREKFVRADLTKLDERRTQVLEHEADPFAASDGPKRLFAFLEFIASNFDR